MEAGKLRQRVILQSFVATRDAYGEPIETWSTVVTLWGAVEPLTGREFYQAQQVNAEITHKVRIRYRTLTNSRMRFLLGTRIFEILYIVNENERNRELIMLCKEIPA